MVYAIWTISSSIFIYFQLLHNLMVAINSCGIVQYIMFYNIHNLDVPRVHKRARVLNFIKSYYKTLKYIVCTILIGLPRKKYTEMRCSRNRFSAKFKWWWWWCLWPLTICTPHSIKSKYVAKDKCALNSDVNYAIFGK